MGGGGGGKIILLCDERKQSGGWESPLKNFSKKLKEIKDQNKKVHKKHEGGCLWFNLYYCDPDYHSFKTHFIIHPPPVLQIKVHFLNLSLMEH